MPFSSPHSYVLDELARKQAQQALMQQQAQQNIGGAVGALKGLNDEMDRQKAHADVLAQQAKDNARADAASKREDLRFDEQKAQDAAANARADDELKLHHSADERAAAADARAGERSKREGLRFDTEMQEHTRNTGKDKLSAAVAAYVGQNGPKADVNGLMQIVAGQPGFEGIGPSDVEAALRDFNEGRAKKTHDENDAAQKEADRIRHEKVEEQQGWARINASKENAAAKTGKEDASTMRSEHALALASSLAKTIRANAKSVTGAGEQLQTAAQDYAEHNHGLMGTAARAVTGATKTPDRAKLETDISRFVMNSVLALEKVGRSVSAHQVEEVAGKGGAGLIGSIGSPTFDDKMKEVERILDEEIAQSAPAAGAGLVGAPPSIEPTASRRANPF